MTPGHFIPCAFKGAKWWQCLKLANTRAPLGCVDRKSFEPNVHIIKRDPDLIETTKQMRNCIIIVIIKFVCASLADTV